MLFFMKKNFVQLSLLFAIFVIATFLPNCQQQSYTHGRIMYENFCVSCHMEDGSGLKGNIPPLAGADFLTEHADQLPCIIRYGINDTLVVNGITYTTPMAGIPQLKDVEIANIINYINHAWGNDNGYTSVKVVQEQLQQCASQK